MHYLPDPRRRRSWTPRTHLAPEIADGQAKTNGETWARRLPTCSSPSAADDGFRVLPAVHAAEPANPRRLAPDRVHAAGRDIPAGHAPVQPRVGGSVQTGGPPALSSKKWARDYNEVKEIGSSTSTTRTPEQTLAARFWAEPPIQQLHDALRNFIAEHQLDIVDAARFMAMLGVVSATPRSLATRRSTTSPSGARSPRSAPATQTATTTPSPTRAGRRCFRQRRTTPSTRARTPASHRRSGKWSPASSAPTTSTSRSSA